MLTVITAAADRSLLTVEELRAAAGVTGSSRDAELVALGEEVADSICQACGIVAAGVDPPSLREETVRQTERDMWSARKIRLDRRPIVSIEMITVDGVALSDADYEVDQATGWLYRLQSDARTDWCAAKVVVEYVAGWYTVPRDLKVAASKLVTALWSESTRDPNLKRERSEFGELEYWVPPTSDPLLSTEIQDLLRPYREYSV